MNPPRTSAKKKAKELAKYLRSERPDYSDRGIRKILAKYVEEAKLSKPISPH